jgi:hypothetical protein
MHMVVALLVWAVWITRNRSRKSEISNLKPEDRIQNMRSRRFPLNGSGGISFCINRTDLFAVRVKMVRRFTEGCYFYIALWAYSSLNTVYMKKAVLLLLIAFGVNNLAKAQTAEDSVKAVVNQLFEGMKTANANLVTGAFGDSAVLQTIARSKEGKTIIRNQQVSAFADFVGKQKPGVADERIQFETIKIDGPLAIVWTPYKFYFNGQFSHCGVNSFQLVRFNGHWKIQYIIDTRRKDNCE